MTLEELETRVNLANSNGLLKVNIKHPEGSEGIWACFATLQDKDVYDRNDGEFEVFLLNNALVGILSWGARLKLTAGGDERPKIDAYAVVMQISEAIASGDYPVWS